MKKSIKLKWVEALRSGKYKQGKGALKQRPRSARTDRFCCLGVLCDIVDPDKWVMDDVSSLDGGTQYFVHKFTSRCISGGLLDAPLQNHVGLKRDEQMNLSYLNDRGATFEKIADYIEENL